MMDFQKYIRITLDCQPGEYYPTRKLAAPRQTQYDVWYDDIKPIAEPETGSLSASTHWLSQL